MFCKSINAMKLFILIFVGFCSVTLSCTSTRNTERTGKTVYDTTLKDSIEYYEAEVEVRQKDYRQQLMGGWNILTMRRQSQVAEEQLSNVFIVFTSDTTFNGKAGCNNMSGRYQLKGTSIKFSDIITTKMACDKLEQETAFLSLLQNTVSAYTVNDNQLLLRDGASNILFIGSRR